MKETGFQFPCGKCLDCRKRRASGWSFRLKKELQCSDTAFFVTLTYDTDHAPITNKGWMTLEKSHLQLFFKRLRWKQRTNDIKYYLAGEYGDRSYRPHYHAIIFNMQLSTLIGTSKAKQCLAMPEMLLNGSMMFDTSLWPYGKITIGTVTMSSIGYTLKYISKPSRIPLHKNDDRKKEFSLMSKGLGKSYLNQKHWHHADLITRMYLPIEGGKKIAMPRYYKEKIYTAVERELIGIHLVEYEQKQYENLTDLEKREKCDKAIQNKEEKERRLYASKPQRHVL